MASPSTYASYPSEKTTIGAGVAIFHLASARVVVCYHTRDKYYFLPKGRRNVLEGTTTAAEREGFEESGYRNRILPLPFKTRQTDPQSGPVDFITEPLWTQLLPLSSTAQYILFWHAAETIPRELEDAYRTASNIAYEPPYPFPAGLTLEERIAMDTLVDDSGKKVVYEPVHHQGTGVDAEEACYESKLLPIDEACRRLKGSVQEDVIRRAWKAIELRMEMEKTRASRSTNATRT